MRAPILRYLFTTNGYRAGPLPKKNYCAFVSAAIGMERHPANNNGLMFEVTSGSPAPGLNPAGLAPGSEYQLMFVNSFDTFVSNQTGSPPTVPFWGGLDAADWVTTLAAAISGLLEPFEPFFPGTSWDGNIIYKAVLSTQAETAFDRLDIQAPIYNTNGDLIATDQADLWDGNISNPVGYDEFCTAVPVGTRVWSGSVEQGIWSGNSCGDWNDPNRNASLGVTSLIGPGWLNGGQQVCAQPARLYGLGPVLTVVPEPGDMNQDGNLTVDDSALFIEALVDSAAYAAHGFPFPADEVGDVNQDGTSDTGDTGAFSALLGGPASDAAWASWNSAHPTSVPEPSAWLLSGLAMVLSAGIRRSRRR